MPVRAPFLTPETRPEASTKPLATVPPYGIAVRPYCGGDWEARGDPIALSGPMRPLAADGSPGAPVTSVSLRNGEAAILMGE